MFAHEKLHGLPRDRVVAAVEPVLQAHGVRGVELIWRMDQQGRVLEVTVEPDGAQGPRDAVTLDVCAELSRDLSTALDVSEAVSGRYRLLVGSPGLDRKLYRLADYTRFVGHRAKLKLAAPLDGQSVIEAEIVTAVAEADSPTVRVRLGEVEHDLPLSEIRSAQLVVDWASLGLAGGLKGSKRIGGAAKTHR